MIIVMDGDARLEGCMSSSDVEYATFLYFVFVLSFVV